MALSSSMRAASLHWRCSCGSLNRALSTDTERVLLHGLHDLPAEPYGIVECREYTLRPHCLKPYLLLLSQHAEERKRLSPFLG